MFAGAFETEKISVLLIEDSRNEAHATQHQLHSIDDEFDLLRVGRLEEALAQIAQKDFSAIILDLGLPDSNGPQSIKIINERFPSLPIVVLSGRNDAATVRSALEYGAQEFLAKNNCSGNMIRQALRGAIIRQSLKN